MFLAYIRKLIAIVILLMTVVFSQAQNDTVPGKDMPVIGKKIKKPFRILASGRRVTIQSIENNNSIKQVLVWTSSGHRIVEQHDLDVAEYAFTIPVNEKIFFLLLEMKDGGMHTEKFGVQ